MQLGKVRYEERLEPVSGRALPVYAGETLRIIQVEGEQCVDFNAFNLHDYKEYMSVGHSRRQGLHLKAGDALISNPPRRNAMMLITAMPETCVADTLGARCPCSSTASAWRGTPTARTRLPRRSASTG